MVVVYFYFLKKHWNKLVPEIPTLTNKIFSYPYVHVEF